MDTLYSNRLSSTVVDSDSNEFTCTVYEMYVCSKVEYAYMHVEFVKTN